MYLAITIVAIILVIVFVCVIGRLVFYSNKRIINRIKKEIDRGDVGELIKREILLKCLVAGHKEKNRYFYETTLMYENNGGEKYKRRGRQFERIVRKRIRDLLDKCPEIYLVSQWRLGKAVCDFALTWEDADQRKHAILIECKHSDSRKRCWKNKQLSNGIDQLNRYAKIVSDQQGYQIDLLALLVDFPIPGKWPMIFTGSIMTFNFSLIEEFVSGIRIVCKHQCYRS